ncbi:MAG: cytochrome c [Chloroflexi bacterium]|nr:cytochrome c [Chloroflexota bacterium]
MKRLRWLLRPLSPSPSLSLALLIGACAPAAPVAPPPAGTGPTLGQLADAGEKVFARACASCHGETGQGITGPPVIGQNAHLELFNTAQGLLDYVGGLMPLYTPGSLPKEEYVQIVAFLLLQNKYAAAGAAFDSNKLSQISLAR